MLCPSVWRDYEQILWKIHFFSVSNRNGNTSKTRVHKPIRMRFCKSFLNCSLGRWKDKKRVRMWGIELIPWRNRGERVGRQDSWTQSSSQAHQYQVLFRRWVHKRALEAEHQGVLFSRVARFKPSEKRRELRTSWVHDLFRTDTDGRFLVEIICAGRF